jgi:hypothetical protein
MDRGDALAAADACGMHEAGAVMRAIASRFDDLGDAPVPQRLRMVIRDPLRAHPDAVHLYAVECLRERGVERPIVTVMVAVVPCASCGATDRSSPMEPVCERCGMPFRALEGPAVVVGEA